MDISFLFSFIHRVIKWIEKNWNEWNSKGWLEVGYADYYFQFIVGRHVSVRECELSRHVGEKDR